MPQILNRHDRTEAFLKFLLFFLITIAVVLLAVYYDFKIPKAENARLKAEVNDQRLRTANQEAFVNKVDLAVQLLDSIDANPRNVGQLKTQLNAVLSDLEDIKRKEVSVYARTNTILLNKLNRLNLLYEENANMRKTNQELKQQNDLLKGAPQPQVIQVGN